MKLALSNLTKRTYMSQTHILRPWLRLRRSQTIIAGSGGNRIADLMNLESRQEHSCFFVPYRLWRAQQNWTSQQGSFFLLESTEWPLCFAVALNLRILMRKRKQERQIAELKNFVSRNRKGRPRKRRRRTATRIFDIFSFSYSQLWTLINFVVR